MTDWRSDMKFVVALAWKNKTTNDFQGCWPKHCISLTVDIMYHWPNSSYITVLHQSTFQQCVVTSFSQLNVASSSSRHRHRTETKVLYEHRVLYVVMYTTIQPPHFVNWDSLQISSQLSPSHLPIRRPDKRPTLKHTYTICVWVGINRHSNRHTSQRKCKLRSKFWWLTGFCNSHDVSHFAAFFIVVGAKTSVAESVGSLFVLDLSVFSKEHKTPPIISFYHKGFPHTSEESGWKGMVDEWLHVDNIHKPNRSTTVISFNAIVLRKAVIG